MKTGASLKNRQGGAVAIMVGFSIFLLIGMAALVVDLGHLYLAKTGLQNAADAAALSGAKQLDGTADGICCEDGTAGTKLSAVYMAVTTGESNSFFGNLGQELIDLGGAKDSSNPNIRFSRDPEGSEGTGGNWGLSITDAKSNPGGIYFVRVDTGSHSLSTWFAAIWNILNTSTKAVAVAGRHETPVAPIGICAIDKDNETKYVSEDATWISGKSKFLAEWGFRRGTSYEFGSINTDPVIGKPSGFTPGSQLYLNPTATSSATCTANVDMVIPLCTGTSAINGNTGSTVYANTGGNTGKAIPAINTRFNEYDSSIITPGQGLTLEVLQASCPPDSNLTEYTPTVAASWMTQPKDQAVIVDLAKWLRDPSLNNPTFSKPSGPPQTRGILERAEKNDGTGGCDGNCTDNYGVLWSYARPLKKTGNTATPIPAQAESPNTDWPNLYPGGYTPSGGYTVGPIYSGASPWAPKYTGNKRRIINAVILDCSDTTGSGSCAEIRVLGLGEFFVQRKADNTGSKIYGEFSRLLPQPLPPANIRLYR